MEARVQDIIITFSDKQVQYIDNIKRIIKNNYNLVADYLGNNRIIDISRDEHNFEFTFHNIVCELLESSTFKQALSDKNFLTTLNLEVLIRKKQSTNISVLPTNHYLNDELISLLIAYKYYEVNGSFENFVEYLKVRDKEEKIFQWFYNIYRWDTYNYLLNCLSSVLKSEDEDFFEIMNYVIHFWINRTKDFNFKNVLDANYPKLSEKEFDYLFYDFLDYINAPSKWVDTYNNLKLKGLIILDNTGDIDNSKCFIDEDGITKILLCNGYNLNGFCTFVHEFIHYFSVHKGLSNKKFTISEFPSIFFEKKAAIFLQTKGYSNNIFEQIFTIREIDNCFVIKDKLPLFLDLDTYIRIGEINKIDKIRITNKRIEITNRDRREMLERYRRKGVYIKDPNLFEINNTEKYVDDDCDNKINAFVEKGLLILNGYQYLLNSYLAELVLNSENIHGDNTKKMIYVTNNLGVMSIRDILSLFKLEFGIDNEVQTSSKRTLKK